MFLTLARGGWLGLLISCALLVVLPLRLSPGVAVRFPRRRLVVAALLLWSVLIPLTAGMLASGRNTRTGSA